MKKSALRRVAKGDAEEVRRLLGCYAAQLQGLAGALTRLSLSLELVIMRIQVTDDTPTEPTVTGRRSD